MLHAAVDERNAQIVQQDAGMPVGLDQAKIRGGSRQSMRPARHHFGCSSITLAEPAAAGAQVQLVQIAPSAADSRARARS